MKISNKKIINIAYLSLGAYITLLLWITLFNRSFSNEIYVYFPFKSYASLFSGNVGAIKDITGNILLFLPFGFLLRCIFNTNTVKTILIGLCTSLTIEIIQLLARVGCFEFDDLLHNSLGTLIGFVLCKKITPSIVFDLKRFIVRLILSIVITTVAILSVRMISEYVKEQRLISFAAMSDSQNQKNLLILNGEEGYLYNKKVCLTYQDDGQLKVNGTTSEDLWLRIAELSLEPGEYFFSGLSNQSNDKIALVLQYYNDKNQDYINLTPYIGLDENTEFKLDKTTKIRAYLFARKGYDAEMFARPVIYKN